MPRTRVLLTGFPPFQGRPINPTQQLVDALRLGAVGVPDELDVFPVLLPVEYRGVEEAFLQAILESEPHVVLAFGVGHQGPLLHLEQVAFNLDDSPVPDNADEVRQGIPIVPQGGRELSVTLPVEDLYHKLSRDGVSVTLSSSAGRFVCNHALYYGLWLAQNEFQYAMTFVHVRPLDSSGGAETYEFKDLRFAAERLLHHLPRGNRPRD